MQMKMRNRFYDGRNEKSGILFPINTSYDYCKAILNELIRLFSEKIAVPENQIDGIAHC